MLTKKQLKVAEEIFSKNEKKVDFSQGLKNFVLNECKILKGTKTELLEQTENGVAKDLLGEFVFELQMPWLADGEYSFIANSDYDRLFFGWKFIDQSMVKGQDIAKDILLNAELQMESM